MTFEIYRGDGQQRLDATDAMHADTPAMTEAGKYLPSAPLIEAVNVALAVGQPLLVTGEPGCGKTQLAWSIAHELGLGDPLQFYTRSDSKAQDLLYTFDAVRRFYDVQVKDERATNPFNYVNYGPLGEAICSKVRRVVLIDEVDKAPRDFPNDLLNEIDRMRFTVHELHDDQKHKKSLHRPIVIITSNTERQLPLPFLRRCVFHHIDFPTRDALIDIVSQRLGPLDLDRALIRAAVDKFTRVREIRDLTKKPATGELLTWLVALHARGMSADDVTNAKLPTLPLWQALLKDTEDHARLREAS